MARDIDQAIIDTAKYLRHIRPIDPEEILEYVPNASQARITRVMQDSAAELELIEAADGTFHPPPDEPIQEIPSGLLALPRDLEDTINAILIEELGEKWWSGDSGKHLRSAIRSFKKDYFAQQTVTYDRITAIGYLLYHFPATFASISSLFQYITCSAPIPHAIRILDIGAGVGGQALAIDRLLPDTALIHYDAIERSEHAAGILQELLAHTGRNFHWTISSEDITASHISRSYDIILLSNVLNELDNPISVLDSGIEQLHDSGMVIAVEPADENTSRSLRSIETAIVTSRTDTQVFGPTLRLWEGNQPTDDCWSFTRDADIPRPSFQTKLDQAANNDGEFCNVDVQYSFSILRQDGLRYLSTRPGRDEYLPLKYSSRATTKRVNICVVKLSHSLREDPNEHDLYVIGDGSQDCEHFAVHTSKTHANQHLETAAYGDIICIQNGLLLWNKDNQAYNVVIDAQATVDWIGPHGVTIA